MASVCHLDRMLDIETVVVSITCWISKRQANVNLPRVMFMFLRASDRLILFATPYKRYLFHDAQLKITQVISNHSFIWYWWRSYIMYLPSDSGLECYSIGSTLRPFAELLSCLDYFRGKKSRDHIISTWIWTHHQYLNQHQTCQNNRYLI